MFYIIGHTKPDLDSAVSAVSFKYLAQKADCFGFKALTPVLADPANNETKFIFQKFKTNLPKVLKPGQIKPADKFILVDHNEETQRLKGIANEQIIEIHDHHKMIVNFSLPIFATAKPWGSTNTIIYWWMEITQVQPGKDLASLMISAILSDTIGFRSPTTTKIDKQAVEKLNKIAQIPDIDALILEIFKAKSNIENLTSRQIVANDYKIFDFSGKKVLINQLETVEQDKVLARKNELLKAMGSIKAKEKVDFVFTAITDIIKLNTKMLYPTEEGRGVVEKAFGNQGKDGVIDIGSKLSRKLEIGPAIEKVMSNQ